MKHLKLFEDVSFEKENVFEPEREKVIISKERLEILIEEQDTDPEGEYKVITYEFYSTRKAWNTDEVILQRVSDGKYFKGYYHYNEYEGSEFDENFTECFQRIIKKFVYD